MKSFLLHLSFLSFIMMLIPSPAWSAKGKGRYITKVEPVTVVAPVGSAPVLPYQVWVIYNKGVGEWRQVAWTNTASAQERMQADAKKHVVGEQYTVRGYIVGDNTTSMGYPVDAKVIVGEGEVSALSPRLKANPLPLSDVRLIGENRLTNNRLLDIRMLLSLDITQQLYNYRDTYGLPTDGYTVSDGWDSPTTKLKGHGTGHYLSALAHAYASATDDETVVFDDGKTVNIKKELYNRIARMVTELRQCQERTFVYSDSLGRYYEARDYAPEEELSQMKGSWAAFSEYKKDYRHYGYGYLNAIPASHPALIEFYRAYNNEEWVWAPYYTIHKQLAGLIDIAMVIPDEIGKKALLIAKDMGLWVWNRMHYRTYCQKEGTIEERRHRPGNRYEMWNIYIAGEVGGMAESLSRLAEMSDDEADKARLIEAANYFDAPAFFDPVARNIDDIRTRHANQHIPMIVGALRSYQTNGNTYYYRLASNFWNMIQGRYAYATGGVGNGEMWRQPYTQIASMNNNMMTDRNGNQVNNPDLNETCCAYNLAKLTKDLNCYSPDDARYMDYYERVLYNQLVGSVHPEHYGVCYQYAVGLNARKPFGSPTPQESCCGGTGAENHVKYQEAAYFVSDSAMWVGLYLPSVANWREKGVTVTQKSEWPAERSVIRVKGNASFALSLRVPYWATDGFSIRLNGKSIAKRYQPCSYVKIPYRQWTEGDSIEITMPFTKHIYYGQDKMDSTWVGTLMFGPLVMATPDVHKWDDAELSLSSNLNDVTLAGTAPYTLNAQGKTFLPDYYLTDEHSTHYLRLDIPSRNSGKKERVGLYTDNLTQLLAVAYERQQAQQQWEALDVKVPEYAPWAPYGYRRLCNTINETERSLSHSQQEIGRAASNLNTVIVSMRPGNLAEPEDLSALLALLNDVCKRPDPSQSLRDGIAYANMVVRYVNDGSGTKDMIAKAISRLSD